MTLLACATFLSAFLLFQLELIIAKILLPVFGGSYLVWGASVVFFQCVLLLGYVYSHAVVRFFGMARYRYLHILALALPLLVFPGTGLPHLRQHGGVPLAADVFGQLALAIGPVFFVLATTSVVFQSLLAASDLAQKKNPYVLYSVSNLGSFAALLTYPFLFEAHLDTGVQLAVWRTGYLAFAALSLAALRLKVVPSADGREREGERPGAGKQLYWLVLSAASAAAFLSVTNIITCEIMPAPLFWMIPLAIYLLTFVLNFKQKVFCPGWIRGRIHYTLAFSVLLFFLGRREFLPAGVEMAAYAVSLFIVCMFCHNSLARSRPPQSGLTRFYLVIALGGFLGGMTVSWVMPVISTSMVEFLFALALVAWSLTLEGEQPPLRAEHARMLLYASVILLAWPALSVEYSHAGLIALFAMFGAVFYRLKGSPRALSLSLSLFFCVALIGPSLWTQRQLIHSHRNYYSVYKISDAPGIRYMLSGATLHGAQLRTGGQGIPAPVIYYDPKTPAGALLSGEVLDPRRMGVVGLGTGTLSVYGKPGREIDFFELDPDVVRLALAYFTYIDDSRSRIRILLGDARISLSTVPERYYELLVIDAFSGDFVPVHLLTVEALREYRSRVTEKGLLLFHVSNRFVDLLPVLSANAGAAGAYTAVGYNPADMSEMRYESIWFAMTWDEETLRLLTSLELWDREAPVKDVRPWTDAYSTVLPVLKLSMFKAAR